MLNVVVVCLLCTWTLLRYYMYKYVLYFSKKYLSSTVDCMYSSSRYNLILELVLQYTSLGCLQSVCHNLD